MLIKVCGMRDAENIREVEAVGIDLMGFIFYPRSPRFVAERPAYLPTRCKRIGVFVDEAEEAILARCAEFGLDGVQLHGHESPEQCKSLRDRGLLALKAFGVKQDEGRMSAELLRRIAKYEGACDYFLFDTATAAKGGSGKQFDWGCLDDYQGATPFLLSGGLNPESITRVMALAHPRLAGLDLNSGFELAPAHKDATQLRNVICQM